MIYVFFFYTWSWNAALVHALEEPQFTKTTESSDEYGFLSCNDINTIFCEAQNCHPGASSSPDPAPYGFFCFSLKGTLFESTCTMKVKQTDIIKKLSHHFQQCISALLFFSNMYIPTVLEVHITSEFSIKITYCEILL